MAKLMAIVLFVAVVGICTAKPARLRNFRQSRYSARQELAEDAASQTPYPPSGIKPDIPFDLPSEPQQPQEPKEPQQPRQPQEPQEPQQPDNTYLPPDNLLPPIQTNGRPDQFNGQPEGSGNGEAPENDAVEVVPQELEEQDDQNELSAVEPEAENIEVSQSGRLISARRSRKQSIKPAKLRSAKLQTLPAKRRRSERLVAQPIYSNKGAVIAYKIVKA